MPRLHNSERADAALRTFVQRFSNGSKSFEEFLMKNPTWIEYLTRNKSPDNNADYDKELGMKMYDSLVLQNKIKADI